MNRNRIAILCGGVGGAKLALGLSRVLPPEALSVIVNVGDDFEHWNLPICPDLDTVAYTLAGVVDPVQGWGRANETWNALDETARLGGESWFRLGDRDLALHLMRQQWKSSGWSLTRITRELARQLGVPCELLPVTDAPVRTMVETDEGLLPFQKYFVARACAPRVKGFRFEGAESAQLTTEVRRVLTAPDLRGIIIAPSNPFVSIGPMLAVPGLRDLLLQSEAPVLAVSPIIGGRALKGPAGKMLSELGLESSAIAVAKLYAGLADGFVLDEQDAALLDEVWHGLPKPFCTDTVMNSLTSRENLAGYCLRSFDELWSTGTRMAQRDQRSGAGGAQ